MFNIRLPLIVVEVLFSAVLTWGCGSSKGNSPHDSGAGDTVTLDTPRDQGAGVTVTLNVTDIGATYANKFIYVGLVAGEVSCESNTDPGQYVGGGMVTSGTCIPRR
jgi:hypothetical protein